MDRKMPGESNQNPTSVTVVVPVYNQAQTLEMCIESLLSQQLQPDSIVVVNDCSTDPTAQILCRYQDHPRMHVISLPRNIGAPSARNAGVDHSRSEVIAFIDADAFAPQDWLAELTAPFADPAVVCAGGPDRAPDGDTVFVQAVDYSLRSWIASGRLRLENPFISYTPAGCNMAIRCSAFNGVGCFDVRLDRRGEEKELIQRLRRGGHRIVYCERAPVWHHRRVSPKQFWRQNFLSGRARVDVLRLAPDAFAWPHLVPGVLVLTLLFSLACLIATVNEPLCVTLLAAYLLALVTDGLFAAFTARSWRMAGWVPLSTAIIHWGYGIGLLVGGLRWLAGYPVGSGSVERTPGTGCSRK